MAGETVAGIRAKHAIRRLGENVIWQKRRDAAKQDRLLEKTADDFLSKKLAKKAIDSLLVYFVERKKKALLVNVGRQVSSFVVQTISYSH